jgi:hypothetical protein
LTVEPLESDTMKNGHQTTIATEPMDVYGVLADMLKAGKLPLHQHAAIAYAMVAMESTFPVSVGKAAAAKYAEG